MLATFVSIESRSTWPTYGSHFTLWKLNCAISLVQMCSSECRDSW